MQIIEAETVRLKIPFDDLGSGEGLFPQAWTGFDFVLLRLETDTGLIGWGEGFSYFCAGAVQSMIEETVIPQLLGKNPEDLDQILADMRHALHLLGRYGLTMFAISAADLALHDLVCKARGISLAEYLGGRRRNDLPAYASMIRYGDTALVERIAAKAAGEGYGMIKLHEIQLDTIRAGRQGAGSLPLTNDVNCNWTIEQTLDWTPALKEVDLLWLEEPIFPPEDFIGLARLRTETGIPLASGENLSTGYQFARMMDAGAVDYVQPSLTKTGGVQEVMEARAYAARTGFKIAHHAPYFGPGLLATLQVLAASPHEEWLEWFYVERAADLFQGMPRPSGGQIAIPDGPGLGLDPDPDVLARYAA